MKSWRIQHQNPSDRDAEEYKSHTSDDREQQLERSKTGWEPPAWLDVFRQIFTPLAFVAQLVTSDLNTITRTGEGISGAFALDSDAATVFEPTPGWFCIWAFIYSGLAFYSVYQAVPEQRASILCRSVGWEAIAALILQSAWGGVASTAKDAAVPLVQLELEGIMIALFLILLRVMHTLCTFERQTTSFDQALVIFPLSMWTGWICLAVLLNTAALARVCGAKAFAYEDPVQYACVIFVAASAVFAGTLIVVFKGCPWFTVSVLWGFLAITVSSSRPGARYIALASAFAFIGIFLTGWWTMWTSTEHTRWGAVSRRFHQLRMTWDGLPTDGKEGAPIAKGLRAEGSGSQYGAVEHGDSPDGHHHQHHQHREDGGERVSSTSAQDIETARPKDA